MQDINTAHLTVQEVIEQVQVATAIEPLRTLAKQMKVPFSGNTGLETLRSKLVDHLMKFTQASTTSKDEFEDTPVDEGFPDDDLEEIEVNIPKPKPRGPSKAKMLTMDPSTIEDVSLRRQVIRVQALRLVRVKIQNLDPNDSALTGGILSIQNKYTGKISKYVPYGEESENGYHIPYMMYEYLKQWKFPLRKEQKGGRFGVKTYKTVMVPKFNIEILPDLTYNQIKELAAHQRASQSIDKTA